MTNWLCPGSNREPSACEADVITIRPQNHACILRLQYTDGHWIMEMRSPLPKVNDQDTLIARVYDVPYAWKPSANTTLAAIYTQHTAYAAHSISQRLHSASAVLAPSPTCIPGVLAFRRHMSPRSVLRRDSRGKTRFWTRAAWVRTRVDVRSRAGHGCAAGRGPEHPTEDACEGLAQETLWARARASAVARRGEEQPGPDGLWCVPRSFCVLGRGGWGFTSVARGMNGPDSPVFDARAYYEQLITTSSLPTLMKTENDLLTGVVPTSVFEGLL